MSFDLDRGPDLGPCIEVNLIQNPVDPVSTLTDMFAKELLVTSKSIVIKVLCRMFGWLVSVSQSQW
jgi:hypothetical protein